jgi:lipopolysaccharide transport system permease protein
MNKKIYYPNKRFEVGYLGATTKLITDTVKSKELVWQLYKRDFVMLNRKTILGYVWHFVSPVIGILSWLILNYSGVLKPGDVGVPYPVYVLFGTSVWGLFIGFFNGSADVLHSGAGFINQVNYPHYVLLFKNALQQLSFFFIGFIFSVAVSAYLGVVPSFGILLVPLLLVPLFLLASSLGLVFAILGTAIPDLRRIAMSVLGLLMYVTPVIYSFDQENPILKKIIGYNPLSYLIDEVRNIIFYGRLVHAEEYIYATAMSIAMFLVSFRLFYISEEKLVEKMI